MRFGLIVPWLRGRLRAVGLDAVLAEDLRADWLGHSSFDAIFILNVLDRCKDPFRMLVLPASQSDAAADNGTRQRRWNVKGNDFESGAASLIRDVFLPSGFEPLRIVRAPYFCAGDSYSPVAALDASVMVLRPIARPHGSRDAPAWGESSAQSSGATPICTACEASPAPAE